MEAANVTWDSDKFIALRVIGPDDEHTQVGEMRVLKNVVVGTPRYVDACQVQWSVVMAQYFPQKVAQLLGHLHSEEPEVTPTLLTPVIVLSVPDYPAPDAVSYVIGMEDAKRFHKTLGEQIREGERETGRLARLGRAQADRTQAAARAEQAKEVTACAVPGCKRSRQFFTDGKGYCKRHAPDRPTGKVS